MNKITRKNFKIEMQNSKKIIGSTRALIKQAELLIELTEKNKLIETKLELDTNDWPKANVSNDIKVSEVIEKYSSTIEKLNENMDRLVINLCEIEFKIR